MYIYIYKQRLLGESQRANSQGKSFIIYQNCRSTTIEDEKMYKIYEIYVHAFIYKYLKKHVQNERRISSHSNANR